MNLGNPQGFTITGYLVSVSPHEDDTVLQALTTKSNFTYFEPTQHFKIHWICL